MSEPINVYEVVGLGPLRTGLQRAAGRGLTRFVGRDREMEILNENVCHYPGREFQGTVTSGRGGPAEPALGTLPGVYATVVLNVPSANNAPRVPDDALIFRNNATYFPVARNDRLHLANVTLGNDTGSEVQIASGLPADNLIAFNVGKGVEEGDPVQPVMR